MELDDKKVKRKIYYENNRYRICKRELEEYIPNKIRFIQGLMSDRVKEYQTSYIYDEKIEKYIREALRRYGVREDKSYYADCFSNASYSYMYSICMCAYKGYEGKHVENYIKKMIRLTIICSINIRDEVKELCRVNGLKVVYLDEE